jgi:ketosteroid isomerase-like protein
MVRMGDAAEDVVRRLYQAVADVDFDAAERCFAPDALWHLPGRSPIAGDHRGWAQIRDNFLAKLGPLSGGTFRAELLDVAVGDTYVVAVQRAIASRGKRTLDITGCQLILVSNGAIQTIRGVSGLKRHIVQDVGCAVPHAQSPNSTMQKRPLHPGVGRFCAAEANSFV